MDGTGMIVSPENREHVRTLIIHPPVFSYLYCLLPGLIPASLKESF
jgi:hypothetical protein